VRHKDVLHEAGARRGDNLEDRATTEEPERLAGGMLRTGGSGRFKAQRMAVQAASVLA
jgi:hypothetical protein